MTYLRAIFAGLLALAIAAAALLAVLLSRERQTARRLAYNQSALMDQAEELRAKNGNIARRVRELTITQSELEESNSALLAQVENLSIRLRDVRSVTGTATRTAASFVPDTVEVFDTVRVSDTVAIIRPARALAYSDDWISFTMNPAGRASVTITDTLTVVRHCRTRRFLWWTFRRYSGRVTVAAACPYTVIADVKTVTLDE